MKQCENMKMKLPRIFIGLLEICDTVLGLAQGLRELGYPVTTMVIASSNPLVSRGHHDTYIPVSRKAYLVDLPREFIKSALTHDIFVFTYCTSFCGLFFRATQYQRLNFFDVSLLKTLGKKIVFISNGDDLRSYDMLIKDLIAHKLYSHAKYLKKELANIAPFPHYEAVRKKRAHLVEEYGDVLFAKPDRAHHLTAHYHIVWPPFNLDSIEYRISQSDEPLILHAPSNRYIKGTKYILKTINLLKKEYNFKFLLCEHMPHADLKKHLAESTIVIDQLLLPGHGMFGIEAMASGNAVLGSAVPGYNGFSPDLPIMTSTPDTLYDNLKLLLEHPHMRVVLAKKGRDYVKAYHDYGKVAADFIQKIQSTE